MLYRYYITITWAFIFIINIDAQIWQNTQIPGGLSSVAMVINKNDKLYVGLIDGIWSSTDDGNNWEWVSETLVNTGVKSLAKTGNGNLIAGTSARGVFISSNNGVSWTESNDGLSHFAVSSIIVVGNNCFVGTIRGGVYLSTNNGFSWAPINNGLMDLKVTTLTFSGNNIFAGTANSGVFVTTNNGISWSQINSGLTNTNVNVLISEGNNLYAGTSGAVFYSDNGGTSWIEINNGIPTFARYINALIKSGSKLFAGSFGGGVFYSTDNGSNWTAVNNGLTYPYIQTIIISGNNIFAGTRGAGVFLSSNDGANWTAINNGLNGNFIMSLFISGTDLFAGTNQGVFKSTNNGNNWVSANQGFPAFSSDFHLTSIATNDTGHIFVSSGSFGVFRSNNNGDSWYDVTNGIFSAVHSLGINNVNGFLFAGTGIGAYRSTNNGVTWTEINQGIITDPNWPTSIGEIAVRVNGDVFATADINYNGLYRSTNSGNTWTKIVNGLVADSTYPLSVSNISFSKNGDIYVYSFNGPNHNGVFRSTNNGNTWIKKNTGLPDNVESIAVNSLGHVFAGVPGQVYRSSNGGYFWQDVSTGLVIGSAPLYNMAINSNDRAFASTSTVWRTINSTSSQTFLDSLKNLNLPITNSNPTITIISINQPPPMGAYQQTLNVSVASIEVSIDELLHPHISDLTLILSHLGIVDTLIFEAGGNSQNFISTLLSDDAEESIINGSGPLTGFYKPFRPLSAFKGVDPYGDWELKIIDGYAGNDGTLNGWSLQISLDSPVLSTDNNYILNPEEFILNQNYPNPFNPSTQIEYTLPAESNVRISVFNILGEKVKDLVNEQKTSGTHTINFNADNLASGIYFYRIEAKALSGVESFNTVKKMLLLK